MTQSLLYYVPLEAYRERYTMQWSAPRDGWVERNLRDLNIPYARVEPRNTDAQFSKPSDIRSGLVVDSVKRTEYSFGQISRLIDLLHSGELTSNDVILFDDFWTPGMEALFYNMDLLGVRPRVYANIFAQSVDEFDFTYPMRYWMRGVEQGWANAMDGIFVVDQTLADLVTLGGIAPFEKVHVTGFCFSSEEVRSRFPTNRQGWQNRVCYSSRLDLEKNPRFMLSVAEMFLQQHPDWSWHVCSGGFFTGKAKDVVVLLRHLERKFDGRFRVHEGLQKEEYYAILCDSKIQFNCASQDFVSLTLMESSVAGCYPVYPYFRSFPDALQRDMSHLYQHLDRRDALRLLNRVTELDDSHWSPEACRKRCERFYRHHDEGVKVRLQIMGLLDK